MNLDGPKVVHLQYLDWERMRSKQRWYQAHERVTYPRKRPIQIYRQYHQMDAIPSSDRYSLRSEWFATYGFSETAALLTAVRRDAYPTDARVLELMRTYGVQRFRRVDLWDGHWRSRARTLREAMPPGLTDDPPSWFDRCVFRWLEQTQRRSLQRRIRWVQRILRLGGW